MLDAALKLLDSGLSIIPVKGKIPAVKWERYQHERATREEAESWFSDPAMGVGVVTGAISNLVVLDIDVKGHAPISDPATWVYAHGLTPTLTVQTPSGGLHQYFTHPGTPVPNAARFTTIGGLPCDIRGDGGFVVAPPSAGYTTLKHWRGMQPWVAPSTTPQVRPLESLDFSTAEDIFSPAPEGQRNHAAARVAGYLLKVSDEAAAWVLLRQWNTKNLPPLSEYELRHTFDSIAKREAMKPRVDARSLMLNSPKSRTATDIEWLEGAAWAEKAENEPERHGDVLRSLPMTSEHRGCCKGDLITIAARPGTGKTSLVGNMFWEVGEGLAESSFFFSGDMSEAEILQLMTKARLAKKYYGPEDWQESLQILRDSRMAILFSGHIATERVEYMLEHRPGTRYVVIDHFNKMTTRGDTRNADLTVIAKDLKAMAGYYGCTFIVLSQINRAGEHEEYLSLKHLAESDALVRESDVIYSMCLVGDPRAQDPERATVRVQMLKNRFGKDHIEQIAWFHKSPKQFEWLPRERDWSKVQ
jgi:hypothetical protein